MVSANHVSSNWPLMENHTLHMLKVNGKKPSSVFKCSVILYQYKLVIVIIVIIMTKIIVIIIIIIITY